MGFTQKLHDVLVLVIAYPIAFAMSIPVRLKRLRKSGTHGFIGLIAAYVLSAVVCFMAGTYIIVVLTSDVNISVSSNGVSLGTLDSIKILETAKNELAKNIFAQTGVQSEYSYRLTYGFTGGLNVSNRSSSTLGYYECYAKLNELNPDGLVNAYQLYVDGEYIGASDSPETLKKAVSEAQTRLTERLGVYGVEITSNVEIIETQCAKSMFRSIDETAAVLDGFTSDDSLVMLSAQVSPVNASAVPKFEYNTIIRESFTEIVKKTRLWKDDFDNYIGYQYQSETGSDGVEEIVYEVVATSDGEELSRSEVERNTIIEMHPDVVMVGAVTPPEAVSTGIFLWPVKGEVSITSYFGEQRAEFDGDSFHYGIDIDVPENTPVMATDGGEVVYSATTRSYGTMIMIAHKDGYKSVYAHLNKSYVSVGDKVYPGQYIADSGNTGVTTGPHLHFEVRLLDIVVDPMKLLVS